MKKVKVILSIALSLLVAYTAMLPAGAVTSNKNGDETKNEKDTVYGETLEEQWKNTEEAGRGITVKQGDSARSDPAAKLLGQSV